MRWIKAAWKALSTVEGLHGLATSPLVSPWLWPIVMGLLTTISNVAASVPLPYLIAFGCFAAACTAHLLVKVDEWRVRTDPRGKLRFQSPYNKVIVNSRDNTFYIDYVQIGMNLKNFASFPMYYTVDFIHTYFMDRIASRKTYLNRKVEVQPDELSWFHDSQITVDIPIDRKMTTAGLHFRISYWHSPRKKFVLERKMEMNVHLGGDRTPVIFEDPVFLDE